MKASERFSIKLGLTAASLAMVGTLALRPEAPARADARVGPPPTPQILHRMAEPDGVRTSISAVRTACASWPRVADAAQAWPQTPDLAAVKDSDLCDFVVDPDSVLWPVRMLAAFLTIAGLVVAATVIGLLHMILVATWSWRPRPYLAPWE